MNSSASFNFDADEDPDDDNRFGSRDLSESFLNSLDRWSKAYWDRLEENPLVTRSITCAIISALGALFGNGLGGGSHNSKAKSRKLQKLSEVTAFALYGGLVGGPLAHYWNQWLTIQTRQQLSTSWSLLVDQLIAQPPMLFLMHLVLDMAGAAVQELPRALHRSFERTGQSLVMSWRFWPVAVYLM
jgi:hypothetical protein